MVNTQQRIDSHMCNAGVRHSIGGADYASVRAGAFMGLRIMTQQKAELGPEPLGMSSPAKTVAFIVKTAFDPEGIVLTLVWPFSGVSWQSTQRMAPNLVLLTKRMPLFVCPLVKKLLYLAGFFSLISMRSKKRQKNPSVS